MTVSDTVYSDVPPGTESGAVQAFELACEIPRSAEVAVAGDQSVSGTVTAGSVVVGGADVASELASLKAELWCLKHCDEEERGDCRQYVRLRPCVRAALPAPSHGGAP